ncbi:MAG: hypothetical protein P794_03280 [Epsilonproteobacteria bacterium (ex Lamellibrachia satsuma)]|nr:MAG: hypothetical protein P794_03280 [Epsilonproteobacteria bacterium (ex Lamellibrachia satsuma)]
MNIFKKLLKLRHYQKAKKEVLQNLFSLAKRTLIALILLETIFLFLLVPVVGNSMFIWYGIIVILTLLRLHDAYLFEKNPGKYSLVVWHKQFVLKAWTTALLLSFLALFMIPQLNNYQQLLIFTILVGISGGAVKALSEDVRTAIGYLLILLGPIAVEMLLLMRLDTIILAFLLILYFFTQISIILRSAELNLALERKNREILKVQAELYKKQETIQLFYKQAPIGIFFYDTFLNIIDCNEAFLALFQHPERENIIGRNLNDFPDKKPVEVIQNSLKNGTQTYIGPYISLKGLELWVEAKSTPIYNSENNVIGGIVLIEDKTKEYYALKELKHLVSHDPLTSLCNRRGFKEFMEAMIHESKHKSYFSILFYLDLNRFKYINDSLGHTFGDKLLVEISKRLKLIADHSSNLTRLGGDEFVIVIPFVSKEMKKTKSKAEECVLKLEECFKESFLVDDMPIHMKASIGVVIIEPNFYNSEEIIRHADISMYQAKKHGHEHISYYNSKLDAERKKTIDLQNDLPFAMQEDQFELFFQPIANIKDDSLRAAESIIRWRHPKEGLVQPADFIPLAIETGVISDIGWWVLDKVCYHISQWKESGKWKLKYVSINLNAKQLIKKDFVTTFLLKLKEYGIDNSDIKVEITETSLINNFEITQQVIKELRSNGIKCAIDDFGTGYSSLSYLRKLSFSVLKIDREFIRDMLQNEDDIILVKTIIEIGKQLNYNIVVEGIEEEKQKEIIKKIDDSVSYQGFLISPPIPEPEFRKIFLRN